METIKEILIRRDGMTADEAESLIELAKDDLIDRIAEGEIPFDICAEWFGLEPDFIDEIL